MTNVTCAACGTEFDEKLKKCPSCGAKNQLKICPVCGAQMAKNAKRCPKCGAKNKKPIYKRWWFWGLVMLLVLGISGLMGDGNTEQAPIIEENALPSDSAMENSNTPDEMINGTWEAKYAFDVNSEELRIVDTSSDSATGVSFNSDGTGSIYMLQDKSVSVAIMWSYVSEDENGRYYNIVDGTGQTMKAQLMSDNYEVQEVRGCLGIRTNAGIVFFEKKLSSDDETQITKAESESVSVGEKQALGKAYDYLEYTAFSYTGLIEQLEFEGFSNSEATYAADNCGADWNEQAALKAQQYLAYSSFSRSGLIEQLEFEGFTHSQAVYGAEENGY